MPAGHPVAGAELGGALTGSAGTVASAMDGAAATVELTGAAASALEGSAGAVPGPDELTEHPASVDALNRMPAAEANRNMSDPRIISPNVKFFRQRSGTWR